MLGVSDPTRGTRHEHASTVANDTGSNSRKYISTHQFRGKFSLFSEQWAPKVIAEMNDYQFKLVKIQGDFIWHDHVDTDETFIVLDGRLRIDFRDGHVQLGAGEMFVVPKGVEHKPFAEGEVRLLLIERAGCSIP